MPKGMRTITAFAELTDLIFTEKCRKCSSHVPPSPAPGTRYKCLTLVQWFVTDELTLTVTITWSPYIGVTWSLGDILWVWMNVNDRYVIMVYRVVSLPYLFISPPRSLFP